TESRRFYCLLGYITLFASEHYAQMVWPDNQAVQVGLIKPVPATAPLPFLTEYRGGLFLGFEVEDVDALYETLKRKGVDITLDLADAPWGQRHFAVMDPNGVVLDFATAIPGRRTGFADVVRAAAPLAA
ncbi:MAG: VOC family protein, partial [Alphaproteobacteria bacterium]